jgi:hypothetical protein
MEIVVTDCAVTFTGIAEGSWVTISRETHKNCLTDVTKARKYLPVMGGRMIGAHGHCCSFSYRKGGLSERGEARREHLEEKRLCGVETQRVSHA